MAMMDVWSDWMVEGRSDSSEFYPSRLSIRSKPIKQRAVENRLLVPWVMLLLHAAGGLGFWFVISCI